MHKALLKTTKKIINSIILLVLSLVMLVGVCFAWVVSSENAVVENIYSSVAGPSIESFTVTAYELTKVSSSSDTTVYQKSSSSPLQGTFAMQEYNSLSNTCTALLLEMNMQVNNLFSDTYSLGVESKTGMDLMTSQSGTKATAQSTETVDTFYWYLSNAIYVKKAYAVTGNSSRFTVKETDTKHTFIDSSTQTKRSSLVLSDDVFAEVSWTENVPLYFILDYDGVMIDTVLSSMVVEGGGGLHTQTQFINAHDDLIFTFYQN